MCTKAQSDMIFRHTHKKPSRTRDDTTTTARIYTLHLAEWKRSVPPPPDGRSICAPFFVVSQAYFTRRGTRARARRIILCCWKWGYGVLLMWLLNVIYVYVRTYIRNVSLFCTLQLPHEWVKTGIEVPRKRENYSTKISKAEVYTVV